VPDATHKRAYVGVQATHLVFICRTKNRATFTPITGSHLAINSGTASLICSRYHSSTTACTFLLSAPGRNRRSIWSCFNSIDGAPSHSVTLSRWHFPQT